MSLSLQQVADVCFVQGGSLQCRYLDEDVDNKGNMIHICKKLSPDKKLIDEEVNEFLAELAKKGHDPAQQGVPLGDNCSGYMPLKTKLQGYDV